jgi:hypothetical protein
MTSAVRGSASTAAEFRNLPTVVVDRAELAYRDEGEGEPVVFAHENEDIAPGTDDQMLPNVDRVEIAAVWHVMHEENASAVNEAILGFLAGRAAPGR